MKCIGLAGLMMLTACAAPAKLGETSTQIFTRYGQLQQRTDDGTNLWHGLFNFKDYMVTVYFSGDESVCESVIPKEQRQFSDIEREALMADISEGTNWAKDNLAGSVFGQKYWKDSDNNDKACVTDTPGQASILRVASEGFVPPENAGQEAGGGQQPWQAPSTWR